MLTTAKLTRVDAPIRPARAWFLPGADPAEWLAETCTWPGSTAGVKYFVLVEPGSAVVAGALALPATPIVLPRGARGLPYGEVVPGRYGPVDAVFAPPLESGEWPLLSSGELQIFHPALGCYQFGPGGACEAAQFLRIDRAEPETWNLAVGVSATTPRLKSVRLLNPAPLTEIYGEEGEDIGREPFTHLPERHDEPADGALTRLGAGAADLMLRGIAAALSALPRTAGIAPTWINHLENWVGARLAGHAENRGQRQHRELLRLLKLLEENPAEGLRHAISLAQLANRGKAPPGSKLGRRNLDFDLSRIGGGRAADFWNIPAQIQHDLATRYRENAQRESRLGHHRRAAYIYGELLGDIAAAAGALKQGRHFREAALLYQERLRQPLLAAECLAEGGLLDEAAEIYDAQAQWGLLADLRERQGRLEAAHAALRRQVEQYRDRRDFLAAARVLEQRLGATDEALDLLASTWPRGAQALLCLEERFAMLGRTGRHAAIPPLIALLAKERLADDREADLVSSLAKLAEETPYAEARGAAADEVRRKVSLALVENQIERSLQNSMMRALIRLEPGDRLLSRDVMRYRKAARPETLALPPAPSDCRLIRRLALIPVRTRPSADLGQWLRFTSDVQGYCGAMRGTDGRLIFARGLWSGAVEMETVDWPDQTGSADAPLLWSAGVTTVILGRPFTEPLKTKLFPPTDAFGGRHNRVGTPDWLPRDTIEVARGQTATWIARMVGERVVLASYSGDKLVHSQDVTAELMAAGAEMGGAGLWLNVLNYPGRVALGYGNCVLVQEGAKTLKVHSLSGRITGLFAGASALPGWIVGLEQGAVFIGALDERLSTLDDAMRQVHAARLQDDRVVLIGEQEGKVFQVLSGNLVPVGWFEVPETAVPCAGVGPGDGVDHLAICHVSGRLETWRIPARS